ncbi:asparagine synthase (glutamine-hydrolyzing) [Microbacterium aurum]
MCGICGVKRVSGPPRLETLELMIGALRHRGPDGAGCYRDANVGLGHARLSIVDIAGGAQPLSNEDGQVWVTFNGEIFNHIELRDELIGHGHRFRTRSDTEVIVHAWEQWGRGCFSRFNGQWALAIWDRTERELILARDPRGILPLFFTERTEEVRFASEVTALFADGDVPREFDPRGFDELLTYWSPVAPQTVYRGVSQVAPGSFVSFGPGGRSEYRYYEDVFPSQPEELHIDLESSAAALREALVNATRLRFLRSDVPVAAYLSGGIDSAVTAGIIARYTHTDLHTYSLRFADAEFDESDYQTMVSRHLGTEHSHVTVTAADIAAAFPDAVRHAETPILRAAPAPMLLLSRLVRESGYPVVVTGEGADEVLAGYDIFREAAVRRFWARDPESAERARIVEALYPWMHRSPAKAPAFAHRFFSRDLDPADPFLSHRPRWRSTAALKTMLTADFAASADPTAALRARLPRDSDTWHPLARAQWTESTTLLPGYILSSQGDRMLMANSVEGRFPFLDPDVGRVAAAMPARHKLMGLDEKHVLKHAFRDLVPDAVRTRPKQPYRAPDVGGFVGAGAPDWVSDVLSPEAVQNAGVFRPDIVQHLVAKCTRAEGRSPSNSDSMRLMAVLSTQILHRDLIAAPPHPRRHPHQPVVVYDELDQRENTHE